MLRAEPQAAAVCGTIIPKHVLGLSELQALILTSQRPKGIHTAAVGFATKSYLEMQAP